MLLRTHLLLIVNSCILTTSVEYTNIQYAIGVLKIYEHVAGRINYFIPMLLSQEYSRALGIIMEMERIENWLKPNASTASMPSEEEMQRLFKLITKDVNARLFGINDTLPIDKMLAGDLKESFKVHLDVFNLSTIISPLYNTREEHYAHTFIWFAQNCANGTVWDRLCCTTNNYIRALYTGEEVSQCQYEIFSECTKAIINLCCTG